MAHWHSKPKKKPNKNYSKDSEEPLSEPQMKSLKIAKIFGPISQPAMALFLLPHRDAATRAFLVV